jgi:hypothetical protein
MLWNLCFTEYISKHQNLMCFWIKDIGKVAKKYKRKAKRYDRGLVK